MIITIYSSAISGIKAVSIAVEVSIGKGLGYQITGLPDEAIKESLTKIGVAINKLGYQMPRTKLVINLAPADMRKYGTAFDLPIAIGILLVSGQLTSQRELQKYCIVGELGLDGNIYPVPGVLPAAINAKKAGHRGIIVPLKNGEEAAFVKDLAVYRFSHLKQIIDFIESKAIPQPFINEISNNTLLSTNKLDFSEVQGQQHPKRALEIAAAGGHNIILVGGPGIGKTMLAKRVPSILPPMTEAESMEATIINGLQNPHVALRSIVTTRPFRSPHHSSTEAALAGGGLYPSPGEITLAHNGVLFLDELPEFKRSVTELLRQPLDDRQITIARSKLSVIFPASFMLIAAMNPCLCGYYGHRTRKCSCSKRALWWYRRRVSGPLLERIDMQVAVETPPLVDFISKQEQSESSLQIQRRVITARNIQTERYKKLEGVYCNAHMHDGFVKQICQLEPAAQKFLLKSMDEFQLSARTYTRILKIARTIADLKAADIIDLPHVAEALSFRYLDKMLLDSHK